MSDHPPLPTVEQCREFLRLVNVGRVTAGLDPLERLDFDNADPGEPCRCLSAINLVCAIDDHADVGSREFYGHSEKFRAAMDAIGATRGTFSFAPIPDAIRVVTDPFDNKVDGLRERMAEAGVI